MATSGKGHGSRDLPAAAGVAGEAGVVGEVGKGKDPRVRAGGKFLLGRLNGLNLVNSAETEKREENRMSGL